MSRKPKAPAKKKREGEDPLFKRLDTFQKLTETHGKSR